MTSSAVLPLIATAVLAATLALPALSRAAPATGPPLAAVGAAAPSTGPPPSHARAAPAPPSAPAAAMAVRGTARLGVPAALPQGRWAWPLDPVPRVVRRFAPGPRPWSRGHRGVDLAARPGQAVLAPADGVIAWSGPVARRPVVVVAHGSGLRTTYEPVIADHGPGTAVIRGQPIGTVARSPASHCSPASCVHWGALRGATYLDPLALLRGWSDAVVLLPPS